MNELSEILQLLNPWWKGESISQELVKEHQRPALAKVQGLIPYRQIVVLSGLRRVGKTTLIYQVIDFLLKREKTKKILFFSFDKRIGEITAVLSAYQELTGVDWKKEKLFVFLDELTKLEDWASKLKLLYDSFPNIKFFVSSSSSIALEEEAIKNLGGRYFTINLRPLSFSEFLELKKRQAWVEQPSLYSGEIKKELQEYLLRSFPEIVEWKDELLIKDYLRSTILDKIVKADLPERFRNINKTLLFELLNLFYKEPGIYLDYDGLSKSLRISKKTLIRHIYYLEFSYLIRIVRNFRVSTCSSLRKLQRVYAYWWTLAYCYGPDEAKLMENIVASYSDAKNYWRKGGKEVDFILFGEQKIVPIEVKNKEGLQKEDYKNMLYFLKKNKLTEGLIIYLGEEKVIPFDDFKIRLVPLWKWLLEG